MKYAGFWSRFFAAILDGVITVLASFFIALALGFMLGLSGIQNLMAIEIIVNILNTIIIWLYFAIMESSESQATYGKSLLGIKVTDLDGNRITFKRATGRYFGKILSALILMIGYIMVAFTEKKQGLHDKLANCLVIENEDTNSDD